MIEWSSSPRAARPMRQGTADRGNRTILKPDFQTGHPQPRIDHLRAGFSPDSVCLVRRKSPSPTPSPKPSQTGKADSCFLFWSREGGQKTPNRNVDLDLRPSQQVAMRLCVGNEWKGILKNWVCPLVGMTLTSPKTSSTASRRDAGGRAVVCCGGCVQGAGAGEQQHGGFQVG